jgi:hypothetical protein
MANPVPTKGHTMTAVIVMALMIGLPPIIEIKMLMIQDARYYRRLAEHSLIIPNSTARQLRKHNR